MASLVGVHDAPEMQRAISLEAELIGINNRDLATLAIDLATTERLAPMAPPDCLPVSESGVYVPIDLERMAAVGVRCFLVGESLMRASDVEAATRALLAPTPPVTEP